MSAISRYLLTITSASIIVSIINSLFPGKSQLTSSIQLICGLFLTTVIISPLLKIQVSDWSAYFSSITIGADAEVIKGTQLLNSEKNAIIKEQCEAYILERAELLSAHITVQIILSEESIPVSAHIYGEVSPYVKRQLTDIISKELGIPEEGQKWY